MDNETYARRITTLARLAHERNLGDLGGPTNTGLRVFLHTYAGGKCALCGTPTRLDAKPGDLDRAEVSHVMSMSDIPSSAPASKRGRMPGNVFNGCRSCNIATDNKDLTRVLHLFADVFAIPDEWTRAQVLEHRPVAAKGDPAAAARKALGFDF